MVQARCVVGERVALRGGKTTEGSQGAVFPARGLAVVSGRMRGRTGAQTATVWCSHVASPPGCLVAFGSAMLAFLLWRQSEGKVPRSLNTAALVRVV